MADAIDPGLPGRQTRARTTTLAATLAAATSAAFGLPQAAVSQTFDQAFFTALGALDENFELFCFDASPDCQVTPGSNLATFLQNNQPAGTVSAAPATVSPQTAAGTAIE